MTGHDLKLFGMISAVMLALVLGVGYVAGLTSGGDRYVPGAPPESPVAFEAGTQVDERGYNGTPIPGYRDVYVNDYRDLLDEIAEERIRLDLIELYDQTGIEMTVLTIGSMRDYGYDGTIESFSTSLFNTWGIGNAELNNGVPDSFDDSLLAEVDNSHQTFYGAPAPRGPYCSPLHLLYQLWP